MDNNDRKKHRSMNENLQYWIKKVILIILCLIIIYQTNAIDQTQFADGNNTFQNNTTYNITIPAYANVRNATLNMTPTGAIIRFRNATTLKTSDYEYKGTNSTGEINNIRYASDNNWDNYAFIHNAYYVFFNMNFSFYGEPNLYFNAKFSGIGLIQVSIYCLRESDSSSWLIYDSGLLTATGIYNISSEIPSSCLNSNKPIITFAKFNNVGGVNNLNIYELEIESNITTYPQNLQLFLNSTHKEYQNTTNFNENKTLSLNLTFQNEAYNRQDSLSYNATWNLSGYFILFPLITYSNSINISIYDSTNLSLILTPITITISNPEGYYYQNITSTGKINYDILNASTYTITATSNLYPSKQSIVIFTGQRTLLPFYLDYQSYNFTFTIRDQTTNLQLENATVSQYRNIAGNNTLVDQKVTDILGTVYLTAISNTQYTFTISKGGYNTKTFTLTSINEPAFTIFLTPISSFNSSSDWYNMYHTLEPTIFYNNIQNNLTLTIIDYENNLTSYGMNITYPTGSNSITGSNPSGSTLTINFTITNALFTDQVIITYWYYKNGINHTFQSPYFIDNSSYLPGSLTSYRGHNFNLGILEQVILIIIVGIIFAFAFYQLLGETGGAIGALFGMSTTAYLLNVSIYIIFPSLLLGIILIARRSS